MAAYVLFGHGLALHELLEFLQILSGIVGYASSFAAIAPGTSCFLIVSFQTFGNVVVNDEAHVGLVYAHAEGDGGHYDVDAFHEEIILCARPCYAVHSGVICFGLDVIGLKHLRQLFHLLAAQAIDNAAAAWLTFDEANDIAVHVLRFLTYLVEKVGAVKGTFELFGIGHAKVFLDVSAHLVSGCGGEGNDGGSANFADEWPYATIFRAEVVAPL